MTQSEADKMAKEIWGPSARAVLDLSYALDHRIYSGQYVIMGAGKTWRDAIHNAGISKYDNSTASVGDITNSHPPIHHPQI